MSKPSKTWDLTLNNYTDADVALLTSWSEDVNRMVVSKEVGEHGTPHLQGRITFKRAYRITALKKLHPRAHWEVTLAAQDFLYVQKEGSEVVVNVDNRTQGNRTELERAIDVVKESIGDARPLKRLAEECPREYVKFHKGFAALVNELIPDRSEVPEVVVFVGPTGCGKSKSAREWLGGGEPVTWEPSQDKWFDGYMGQKEFLFEEFRGQLPMGMMLSLLDRYTAKVQYKGGMARFVATRIAITSPLPPEEWYPNLAAADKIDQLLRRITRVEYLA